MKRLAWTSVFLVSILVAVPAAAAAPVAALPRPITAVLWLDDSARPSSPEFIAAVAAVDRELAASAALAPVDDAELRRVLSTGGPLARMEAHLIAGKERFASLRELELADADLAAAEEIAGAELPVADACAQLVDVARLRLRYAELSHREGAAIHAARVLAACLSAPTPEDAAAIERHAATGPEAQEPAVRVESEPSGATVYLDLRPLGVTPLWLPTARDSTALLDVELPGFRKVHRAVPAGGIIALSLAREDRLAALVDRIRGMHGNAGDAEYADLGKRVGASRLMVLRRDPDSAAARVQARVLDVKSGAWVGAPIMIATTDVPASSRQLVEWAAGGALPALATVLPAAVTSPRTTATTGAVGSPVTGPAGAIAGAPARAPTGAPGGKDQPSWKKWYTWAIAGALVAVIGGFFVAQHVGDDQVTVDFKH